MPCPHGLELGGIGADHMCPDCERGEPAMRGRMRRIASEWHGGQHSPTYSFTSTGTITDALRTEVEALMVGADITVHEEEALDELSELHDYLVTTANRGPVEGWDQLWER